MPTLAKIALLALAGALVVNLVQGGPDQARAWLSAKFLGRPLEHPGKPAPPQPPAAGDTAAGGGGQLTPHPPQTGGPHPSGGGGGGSFKRGAIHA